MSSEARPDPSPDPSRARAVILVEGRSDRLALLALAGRLGIDVEASGIEIVAMNGVTNLRRHLAELQADGRSPQVVGLFDAGELPVVARMLRQGGYDVPATAEGLESVGFFACTLDLEDELIRALGADGVESVIADMGDLGRFRVLQAQPYHRGRPVEEQLHRFAGTAAGRKTVFAERLLAALPLERVPRPLTAVLAAARG